MTLPLRLRHRPTFEADHPLAEELVERLADLLRGEAEVAECAGEEARVEQVQDRVGDAADVLVDRHVVQRRVLDRPARSSSKGLQKRRKYHEESTKVSIVSVSRVAGPPQIGQVVRRKPLVESKRRLAGREELDVVGEQHRQLGVRQRRRCRRSGSRRPGSGSPSSAGG